MKVLANEYGQYGVRVNTIHPNAIATEMVQNETLYGIFRPDLEKPTLEDALPAFAGMNPFKVPFIDPVHVSNAVVFLASDEALYISGAQLPVDAAAAIA
jgi:(-)-trans-carveol dehydrogenase